MIICNYIEKQTDNRGGIFYHVQKSGSSGIFPYYPVGEHLFGHYDRPRSGQRGVARRHHLRMSYVRSIYGAPTDRVPTKDYIRQDAFSNIYGNSFYVIEYPKNSSVEELYVTANNGLATPMGITVGIPKSTVDKLYGEGSFVQGSYRYLTQEGKVIQIKYVDDANDVAVVKSIYIRYSA